MVMTKIEGCPDRVNAVPGMAYFSDTGPFATTCGECRYLGYSRESRSGKWHRVSKCAKFKELTGRHGADVSKANASCKYFAAKQ